MEERTAELLERRAEIEKGGGEARQEKQHAQGKLTARERVRALLDPGTLRGDRDVRPALSRRTSGSTTSTTPPTAW